MLKVVLWSDWFAPNGQIYRRSNPKNPTGAIDISEDLAGWDPIARVATKLPSSAQVVSVDERKPLPPKRYDNPAHLLDPQHVTDFNNRRRELEEQAEAQKKADAEEAKAMGAPAREAKAAVTEVTRVTADETPKPEDDKQPEGGETEIEKAIREAEEARAAETAAKNTAPAGAPKKKRS